MLRLALRRVLLLTGCRGRLQSTEAAVSGRVVDPGDHLPPITFHPRPHGIPAAILHFRSHHIPLLNLFTYFAVHTASALGIPISAPTPLPTKRTLWTVPRGPFAHKKSQENFDRKVHKRVIKAWDADPTVVGLWALYLRTYQVGGVGLRVVRWERAPVGFGKARLARVVDAMEKLGRVNDRAQVAALGEEIVKAELKAAEMQRNDEQP